MRWVAVLVPLFVQPALAQQVFAASHPSQGAVVCLTQSQSQRDQSCAAIAAGLATPPGQPPGPPVNQPATDPPVRIAPDPTGQPAAESARQGMTGMEPGDASGFPTMQFRGFSDVTFHASDLAGTSNTFSLGQFNLFITSKISDRAGVLAEVVAEADDHNTVGVDLERLLFHWTSSDYLSVSVGRYHTAIGWYNTAYHHSTWMQTAVGRPFLFEFEDKGGILPIHNVGISVSGRIPSGELGLRYVAEIGNGRTSRSRLDEPVQNLVDENSNKAINLALLSRPAKLSGFEAGVSVYFDKLTPAGLPTIGQTIMSAHAVYQTTDAEWLNEVVVIRNLSEGADHAMNTTGFYTQVSKKFDEFRPYFRYQYVNVPEGDVLYPDVGLQHGPSVGVRYDAGEFIALKIQFDRTMRRQLSSYNSVAAQLSFTF